ncbi:MAG: response regulator [Syntrophomonadaceae bacterium]|jgi:two-component system response regulator YesN|nr:response regulator [Syntrophomonadaceae bacterium]
MRILILEDEEIIKTYFEVLARPIEGVTAVATTKSGEHALELAASFKPNLAILDFELRGQKLNGLQIGAEIKKLDKNIFFVLISGYPHEYFSAQATKPDAFILKPVGKTEFQSLVASFAAKVNPV